MRRVRHDKKGAAMQIYSTNSPEYRDAFRVYLRKGTPLHLSLKARAASQENRAPSAAEHITTHYVWRTRGDDKVRASHAANNGKIFMWNNPPATGHPGTEHGCRCWAEPFKPRVSEFARQVLISNTHNAGAQWAWYHFVGHYYLGNGRDVHLIDVGQLHDIVVHAENFIQPELDHSIFTRVQNQIIRHARNTKMQRLNGLFRRTYDFKPVSYVHGGATVEGTFSGAASVKDNELNIRATINYHFSDEFTDPASIREKFWGVV
ncbi:MAG: hypothetical protein EB121_03600 [Alphaproteobacteria bacterium]|nr:hypothetical protein [Alphaproteobacteria bacterium]